MNVFKKYREAANMTQAQLAKELGVSASTVAMWEIGVNVPQTRKLKALAKALGVAIEELLEDE